MNPKSIQALGKRVKISPVDGQVVQYFVDNIQIQERDYQRCVVGLVQSLAQDEYIDQMQALL